MILVLWYFGHIGLQKDSIILLYNSYYKYSYYYRNILISTFKFLVRFLSTSSKIWEMQFVDIVLRSLREAMLRQNHWRLGLQKSVCSLSSYLGAQKVFTRSKRTRVPTSKPLCCLVHFFAYHYKRRDTFLFTRKRMPRLASRVIVFSSPHPLINTVHIWLKHPIWL